MTRYIQPKSRTFLIAATLATSTVFGGFAVAADKGVAASGGAATGITGNGSMNDAARASFLGGALPASAADVAAKKAADAAYDSSAARRLASSDSIIDVAAGEAQAAQRKVSVLASFAGQSDAGGTPPDTTGAVGPTRFVQLVNRRFGIYTKTGGLLSAGTLNQLGGWGAGVNSFDPQIIWDPTTNRFYYAMDSIVSSTDNRLAFGFSKTASPNSAADWCKYFINSGVEFPDFPKLGDSQHFILIGVNQYNPNFLRADLFTANKPPNGTITTCPTFASLNARVFKDLKDTAGNRVFSPTPANSIDTFEFGYVIARNLSVPSNKIWEFPINRNTTTGLPQKLATRTITLPSTYTVPPSARQPTLTQVLDTSDTRLTQAVLARNPARSNAWSLWTQQTVANGSFSKVRVYEVDPSFTTPIVRRVVDIASSTAFLFNAAVSPDRRVDGGLVNFGQSAVVGYSVTSTAINPRIVTGSSLNGAPFTFATVKNSTGPYRDFSCAGTGQRCRWGDYAGATPDPRDVTARNVVWLTNQYGSGSTSTATANWRTWIWSSQP